MKRGAIILAVLSIAINPWRFLTQASIFITVISTFSIFSSCTSPMLNVDYWIVRKKAWKIPDLYHADGIYWYYNGWNLRAVAAWLIGVAPSTGKCNPISKSQQTANNIFCSWCCPRYHGDQLHSRR